MTALVQTKLIEVQATNISYKHNLQPTFGGGGGINVDYGGINYEFGETYNDDPSYSAIVVTASPEVRGFRYDNDNDNEFHLKIDMRLIFVCDKSCNIDIDFVFLNEWYFSSFLRTYFKFYAEGIFEKSPFKGIKLPYN
ncbi:TPA: hypothetical protein R4Y92_002608 [Klebsiella aerogenes]|uniref:hypothetical protein n=1 Tax=Klebsiella aerogenes TaxID=548 RepID=UPI001E4ADA6B|nr:hypothetical protein [Klebsiella aerogenes]MCD0204799.1 hypothetical protein [Klebsiella aerogenes]HED2523852.1 hypothetical protein [Klebsiella aerogenes]